MKHRLAIALVLIVAVGVAMVCFTSYRNVVYQRRKLNLLLVTVDTLRADHMSLYGYERRTTAHLERWLGRGRIFDRAYATETSTTPSVVSILTGLLPQRHRVRLLYQKIPDQTLTLARLLDQAGYETAAVVSNVVLTDEASGLGSHFYYYDDFVDEKEPYRRIFERRASRTTDAAIKWLRNFRPPEKPHFLWVHYNDPHGPYHPPSDRPIDFTHRLPEIIDIMRVPDYQREPGVSDGLEYVDLYDEEVAYADREIGRLLEEYDALGLMDGTLVVFAADHGETMMEHERWFTHAYHVYEPLIHVPFAIVGKGVVPGRVKTPVSLVDLVPTVIEALGLHIAGGFDGRSVGRQFGASPVFAEATYGGGQQWRCAVTGEKKWLVAIRQEDGAVLKKTEYRIEEEAGGVISTEWDAQSPVARKLIELARDDPDPGGWPRQFDRGQRLSAPKVAPDVDEETLEKLRRLGYVD